MPQLRTIVTFLVCLVVLSLTVFSSPAKASELPFSDVPPDAWYAEAVQASYQRALLRGVDATHFAPQEAVSRATLAQVLSNIAPPPTLQYSRGPYLDIPIDHWAKPAILWSVTLSLMDRVDERTFSPDTAIQRGEAIQALYRLAQKTEALSYSAPNAQRQKEDDAIAWAMAAGIALGTPDTFHPEQPLTRAELAQFLYRVWPLFENHRSITRPVLPQAKNIASITFRDGSNGQKSTSTDPLVIADVVDRFHRAHCNSITPVLGGGWSCALDLLGNNPTDSLDVVIHEHYISVGPYIFWLSDTVFPKAWQNEMLHRTSSFAETIF